VTRVAIVGSREGVDETLVRGFVRRLAAAEPGSVVISGGADGVDTWAEREALQAGLWVVSYRPQKTPGMNPLVEGSWCVQKLTISPSGVGTTVEYMTDPTWADKKSALFYRNTLIVDDAEVVVAFHANDSPGTRDSKAYAEARQVPVYDEAVA
jgi:DNA recombination-mediator protein A